MTEKKETLFSRSIFLSDFAILFYLAFIKLLIHLATNLFGGYGIFRDELYYIACSNHLAWGYVDQPPLSIAVLWIERLLLGDSLFALRFFPAIAGACTVILAGLITKEMGGKRFAQVLASCAVITAPQTLGTNSYFSMNSFDLLIWTCAFYIIILIIKRDNLNKWILLGVLLGIGLLNKISVLWLGAGLFAGLLLTQNRKLLLTRKVWIALAIAFFLFLPHIIWQVIFGFPTLEFIKNATANKYVAVAPFEMFIEQASNMNIVTLPIWFAGLIYFLLSKSLKQFRILPIIFITVFLILVINRNSKTEYLGPMFPMLFALGAFTFEKVVLRFNWNWLKPVVLVIVILVGIISAPFAIAILPVDIFIKYSQMLGKSPSTPEKKEVGKLPQYYADMFGWEKMTAVVARAYNTLTPHEKGKCIIFCNNYGEAGAIDFFGEKYNLPKAISGHNNYWLWGPRNATGNIVIRLGGSPENMRAYYNEVIQMGTFNDDYCMPYENNMSIWICKNRHSSFKDDWQDFKHFD